MYCGACGNKLESGARFCSQCGAAIAVPQPRPVPSGTARRPEWYRRHPILALAGILVVIFMVAGAIQNSGNTSSSTSSNQSGSTDAGAASAPQPTDTAAPPYRVAINGWISNPEYVGSPATLQITAQNEGRKIPHLVLSFDGLGSWVINSVQGCHGAGQPLDGYGNPYDFGPVSAGGRCHVTLNLVAKTAGNPTLSLITYANIDSDTNTVDVNASVDNKAAAVQWNPAINP